MKKYTTFVCLGYGKSPWIYKSAPLSFQEVLIKNKIREKTRNELASAVNNHRNLRQLKCGTLSMVTSLLNRFNPIFSKCFSAIAVGISQHLCKNLTNGRKVRQWEANVYFGSLSHIPCNPYSSIVFKEVWFTSTADMDICLMCPYSSILELFRRHGQ